MIIKATLDHRTILEFSIGIYYSTYFEIESINSRIITFIQNLFFLKVSCYYMQYLLLVSLAIGRVAAD